jgi:hypothetical protein
VTSTPSQTLTATGSATESPTATVSPTATDTSTFTATPSQSRTKTPAPPSKGPGELLEIIPAPNPARGGILGFSIRFNGGPQNIRIVLYDVSSQMVLSKVLTPSGIFVGGWTRGSLQAEKLASGVYFGYAYAGSVKKPFKIAVIR